jgi:inorganic pyrophosphatase
MQRFFEDYKKLENKNVVIEKFMNKAAALEIVKESIELYRATFPK